LTDTDKRIQIDLTVEEIEVILGAIANTRPADQEHEKKLYEIYFKLRLLVPIEKT